MICCAVGHRPENFPFEYENENSYELMFYKESLFQKVDELIKNGYTDFITGIDKGVDMDFASTVLYYKNEKYSQIKNITLEIVIPCRKSESDNNSEEYNYIISKCDKKTVMPISYSSVCVRKKNEYMIDRADMLFAVWDGKKQSDVWSAIKYAEDYKKPVEYIMLGDYVGEREEVFNRLFK